jgi:predicted transcriptional regulator
MTKQINAGVLLPAQTVAEIDALAKKFNSTRSFLIESAILEYLKKQKVAKND